MQLLPTDSIAPVEGGGIAYRINGAGPPLVSTHPYAMPARGGHAIPGVTTITVWPRGFGRSSAPRDASDYGIWRLADDVEAVRQHLQVSKWAFWGVSMGGFTGLTYALDHQQALCALILDSTAASHHYTTDPQSIWPDVNTSEEARRFFLNPTPENRDAFFARMRSAQVTRDPTYQPPTELDINAAALRQIMATLDTYDVRTRLHEIRVPTLVLAGERDSQCTPGQARIIAAGVSNARLEVFPNIGHGVVRADRPSVLEMVRKFIATACTSTT